MKRIAFLPHNNLYIQHMKTSQKYNMQVQHYHDAYEIYLQLDGKRYLFFDNICYTLERGAVVIVKPFDIHYAESRESDFYERYVINFHDGDLSVILDDSEIQYLLDKLDSCVLQLDEWQTKALTEDFRRIDEFSKENGVLSKKSLHSALIQLLDRVLSFTGAERAAGGKSVAPYIEKAIKYINMNYRDNLTLDGICEAVSTSKYHFCRSFKTATGATAMEYLNNVRLTKVHNLLLNTKMNIDEIADLTGFSSAVNLTRAFKKVYGSSPRDFRKLKKNG